MKRYNICLGLVIIFSLIFISSMVYGQSGTYSVPNFYPTSPEAASLFKSIDIPLNKTTGVPDLSVPIYEIKLSDISIPISLSYNSSGNRVDEVSSNVGLGWSLVGGGMISSSINGQSDLEGNGYPANVAFPIDREMTPQSYVQPNSSIFKNADYQLLTQITGNQIITISDGTQTPIPNTGDIDTQPDMFYYSYPGGSGKFFMTKGGGIHTIPFSPIRINRNQNFQIVTGDGVKYSFLQTEVVNITSLGFTNHPDFGGVNSTMINYVFHLTKIETPGGNVVDYQYDDVSYSYKGKTDFTRYKTLGNADPTFPSSVETRIETEFKVFGKNLRRILVNGQQVVEFLYETCNRIDLKKGSGETGGFALDKVRVYKGGVTEEIDLIHGYYNIAPTDYCNITKNDNLYRLKLLSVQRIGEEPYTFNYFGNNSLPPRDDLKTDHWGYYSASNGGKFQIDNSGIFVGGSSKAPDLTDTRNGVIEKIKYPTKGVSEFVYELNQARDTLNLVNVSDTNHSVGLYYQNGASVQTQNFNLQSGYSNYANLNIMYNTTPAPDLASPRFTVTLTGPNGYWRQFQSINGYENTSVSLPVGNYTLTVEQTGVFEEGYVNVFWITQQTTYTSTIDNYQLGGLRVKEIRNLDREGGSILTRSFFDYTTNANPSISSGRIANKPQYLYTIDKIKRGMNPLGNGILDKNATYYVQSSSSALPMMGLNGYHVLYTEVTESKSSNKDNGYVYSKYSFANDLKAYVTFPAISPTSYNWMRGLLLMEEVYAKNGSGSSFRIVKRTENLYQHLYTDRSATNYSENFAHYTPPNQFNESHGLGLSVELIAPEWVYQNTHGGGDYKPAIFRVSSFKLISSWTKLIQTKTTEFDSLQVQTLQTISDFSYDNPAHALASKVSTLRSDGVLQTDYALFPHDFTGGNTAINEMRTNGFYALPIEKVQEVTRAGQKSIVGGQIFEYKIGSKGLLDRVYSLSVPNPILSSQFKFSNSASGNPPIYSGTRNYARDTRYFQRAFFETYDLKGNPVKIVENQGAPSRIRWDTNFNNVYGICKSCNPDFFAFTSFEDAEKGGWTYSGAPTNGFFKTGAMGYNLSSGAVSISSIPVSSSKFKVGFWARSTGASGTVNVGGVNRNVTSNWQWVENEITTASLSISGSNIIIDELRLHPTGALVETYTYKQLRLLSSKTDPSGRVLYYEYDALGRLKTSRDEMGNILEHFEYNYATGN